LSNLHRYKSNKETEAKRSIFPNNNNNTNVDTKEWIGEINGIQGEVRSTVSARKDEHKA